MTNRYELDLLGVAHAILADACACFPDSRDEIQRDQKRLISLVESRGLALFTLDLPALGKHFDMCLSEGLFVRPLLPLSRRRSPTSVIPRLFQGLLIRVFNDSGFVLEEPDVNAILFLRQIYYFAKKLKSSCKPSAVYNAVTEFANIEEVLPDPDLPWSGSWDGEYNRSSLTFYTYRSLLGEQSPNFPCGLLGWLQETCDILASHIGVFDPIGSNPKHGPGAVSDLKWDEFKYSFPSWDSKLEAVFPFADLAYANYGMWADDVCMSGDWDGTLPSHSKLIAVPKTMKGPRLIAKEPTAYQYCQQAIWSFIRDRSRDTFIGSFIQFSDQRFNQEGARLASQEGKYWTIDLSSASDRLTCRFIERAWRSNPSMLRALYASRTQILIQDIDKKNPRTYVLRKFSTQGSACTFPIESLAFLAVALAATLFVRGRRPSINSIRSLIREVRVFGDDIIVPADSGELVCELLGYLDFKVNEAKTFGKGKFRESCGFDGYAGIDVSPAYYIRTPNPRSPETVVSNVATSNNFFMKGFWKTAQWIQSTVRNRNISIVHADSGLFGWLSFSGSWFPKTKWDADLQKVQYYGLCLRGSVPRTPVDHHGALLQYFQEKPDPEKFWSSGKPCRPKLKLVLGRVDG